MFLKLYLILSYSILFFSSCCLNTRQLLVKNISADDSIDVIIKIDDKIFRDSVPIAISSFSYIEHKFCAEKDISKVEVILPKRGISKIEYKSIQGIKQVIVTIRSMPQSFIPLKNGDLNTIPKMPEILIGFFGERTNIKVP